MKEIKILRPRTINEEMWFLGARILISIIVGVTFLFPIAEVIFWIRHESWSGYSSINGVLIVSGVMLIICYTSVVVAFRLRDKEFGKYPFAASADQYFFLEIFDFDDSIFVRKLKAPWSLIYQSESKKIFKFKSEVYNSPIFDNEKFEEKDKWRGKVLEINFFKIDGKCFAWLAFRTHGIARYIFATEWSRRLAAKINGYFW